MNRSPFSTKFALHVAAARWQSRGYSLVVAIGTIVVLSTLLASYSVVSRFESLTASSSEQSGAGFYAAEAGLNLRADVVRSIFDDFNIPTGTSEDISVVGLPCLDGVGGTDDYSCITYQFQDFTTQTGLAFDDLSNIVIPPGEPFQFLNAQEFRYLASAISYRNGDIDSPQAILGMNFLNRSVPMFQFMAFFDKDLEIRPGSSMTLNGPLHANGNIFLNAQGGSGSPLTINDRISIGDFPNGSPGNIYRVSKHDSTLGSCTSNSVLIEDNNGVLADIPCSTSPVTITTNLDQQIATGFPRLEVPSNSNFGVGPSGSYWSSAELRVALNLATSSIEVRTVSNTVNAARTVLFSSGGACNGTFTNSTSFYNAREADFIEMLEVDMNQLLDCINTNSGALGFGLDDETQGGLVIYLTVDGPLSDAVNNYGVRLQNGSDLRAANVEGLTIITDQAVYIQGDYNTVGWVPASVIGDSLNILSNAWSDFRDDGDGVDYGVATSGGGGDDDDDDDDGGGGGTGSIYACSGLTHANCLPAERLATDTAIFAAFLAGTTSTGWAEGGFNTGSYNGGMHNYPRLHEIWTSRIDAIDQYNDSFSGSLSTAGVPDDQTLTLVTSFISLQQPDHVDGLWQQGSEFDVMWWYQQPIRNFSFDNRFRDPNQLPPMTPQVTYLQQQLFVRNFNR